MQTTTTKRMRISHATPKHSPTVDQLMARIDALEKIAKQHDAELEGFERVRVTRHDAIRDARNAKILEVLALPERKAIKAIDKLPDVERRFVLAQPHAWDLLRAAPAEVADRWLARDVPAQQRDRLLVQLHELPERIRITKAPATAQPGARRVVVNWSTQSHIQIKRSEYQRIVEARSRRGAPRGASR